MEEQILKNSNVYPSNEVIKENLNNKDFDVYLEFLEKIKTFNLNIE